MTDVEDRFTRMCEDFGGTVVEGEYGHECDVDPERVKFTRSSLGVFTSDDGGYLDHPHNTDFSDRSDDWNTDVSIRLNGMELGGLPSGYDPVVEVETVRDFEMEVSEHGDWFNLYVEGRGSFR